MGQSTGGEDEPITGWTIDAVTAPDRHSVLDLDIPLQRGLSGAPSTSLAPDWNWPIQTNVRATLHGWLGDRWQAALHEGLLACDVASLVAPFSDKRDSRDGGFRGEFLGKWLLAMIDAARHDTGELLAERLSQAIADLVGTQEPDGYVGTYAPSVRGRAFDVWNQKYTLWALAEFAEFRHDRCVLDASRRMAKELGARLERDGKNVADMGPNVLAGVNSSSILHPLVLLSRVSKDATFVAYAREIVDSWHMPAHPGRESVRLVDDLTHGVSPANWTSAKAYELMSCVEGLIELARAQQDAELASLALRGIELIARDEITVIGSGSSQELWYQCGRRQTASLAQPHETCVTAYWMRLCLQALHLTDDPRYAEALEISLHNALLGAMSPDGRWWSYFLPLSGYREPSVTQFTDIHTSCCVLNGYRALMAAANWLVESRRDEVTINSFAAGDYSCDLLSGATVDLHVVTTYPASGHVEIIVEPDRGGREFEVRIRIPSWSTDPKIQIDDESAISPISGQWARLGRRWGVKTRVIVDLDQSPRLLRAPGDWSSVAVMRGPLVLVASTRERQTTEQLLWLRDPSAWPADALVLEGRDDTSRVAIAASFQHRTSHYFSWEDHTLQMIDFASAAAGSNDGSRYQTWFAQPFFDALAAAYDPGPECR